MKKMMKRIGAVLLAVAMMAALSMSAWATEVDPGTGGDTSNPGSSTGSDPDPGSGSGSETGSATTESTTTLTAAPSRTDTETVTIRGLQSGDVVTFYQIVKANYKNNSSPFEGYEAVKDDSIALFDANNNAIYPTAAQLADLANDTTDLPSGGTATANASGVATKALAAGEWLAVVSSTSSNVVYNPMVVSVYYTSSSGRQVINGGNISAADTYSINGSSDYAKSSEPTINKTIASNSMGDKQTDKGDDHKIGDTVSFNVTTQIPDYRSGDYEEVIYQISDTSDAGLDLDADTIVVTVGGQTVTAGADTYTVKNASARGFTIDFDSDYAIANSTKTVVVTYDGTINANAGVNFDPTTNTAKLTYSNNPSNKEDTKEKESKTYQYTFEIDGAVTGNRSRTETEILRKNHEIIKTREGEPNVSTWIDDGTETKISTSTEENIGLAGAQFTLTQIKDAKGNDLAEANQHTWTATTSENGYFSGFTGLDAGTYELVESVAPDGYALDTTVHPVVITAIYNTDGTLKTYTITIDGTATSTYTATYDGENEEGDVKITEISNPAGATFIKNTKTSALPSTGGIGTYVFTVAGVAIMVVAAGLLIVRHKKKA